MAAARTTCAQTPAQEIAEALAKKLGVPLKIVSSPDAAGIASALSRNDADIGVLAYDVERTRDVDYGAAGDVQQLSRTGEFDDSAIW